MGFMWGGKMPWRTRFFEDGEVRLAILSLLSEGEKNGYQLMKELKDRSGGMYKASAGSIYPTLQMLEDEGLIAADAKKEGRRMFHLTDAGREELGRDPESVKRIWDRAESWEDWARWSGPPVMAFASQLQVLIKSTMRAAKWADGIPERDSKLRTMLQRMSKELEELVTAPASSTPPAN